jgi:hypothetical protein
MIMFGVNSKHELLQDVHVLNMTNVTSPAWVGTPLPSPSSSSISKSGLSSGAIAGIVVAAVVASVKPPSTCVALSRLTSFHSSQLDCTNGGTDFHDVPNKKATKRIGVGSD